MMARTSQQYAIIGGPSAGKTTLIDCLRDEGFAIVEDAARILLTSGHAPDPLLDRHAFQQDLLIAQLAAEEQTMRLSTTSFVDGGVFDGCAYYLCDELPVPTIYGTISGSRYNAAFLLESLDNYVNDGVRYQNKDFTNQITSVLEDCYLSHAVKVIRVARMPLADRLEYILAHLPK